MNGQHEHRRVALIGGVYNNYLALQAAIADARRRGVDAIYCLGDLGAFGPHPDRVFPLLIDHDVQCVQGNYDNSIGNELNDCQCGYTDPRDNYFAQISYDYTQAHTSAEHRRYLRDLPTEIRFRLNERRVLLCHGSPRRTNEFVWESSSSNQFLRRLADEAEADIVCATHTGIKWQRTLPPLDESSKLTTSPPSNVTERAARWINIGVLGRPENDGRTCVWYTLLEDVVGSPRTTFVPVEYDHCRLAGEMRAERLPEEFITTIETGWWTTCLEILPSKERRRGPF
ncbi:MAG: metallophosphoesterase family protein [Planctomycetales bacterium]|nr:metallophosphoesterase family protein [Planctomycetales bacterium]